MEFLKDGKLMSAFLIDYENINGVSILPGLDLLSPKINLFYSILKHVAVFEKSIGISKSSCWYSISVYG